MKKAKNPLDFSPDSELTLLYERGIAHGRSLCILETLSDYGNVPSRIREQILHQTKSAQLKRWFALARQVRSIEEFLFRM